MDRFNISEDTPIENGMVSKSIESAQGKIEGFNFDARKHVLDYDDVLNKQRGTIYSKRVEVLEKAEKGELKEVVLPLLEKYNYSLEDYEKKEKEVGIENMRQIEKVAALRVIDNLWIEHLENMESLKDSVRLRAYGQRDPLVEYKKEGHKMFRELLDNYERMLVESIMRATIKVENTPNQMQVASEGRGNSAPKSEIGRNDPCPCGSGKKYKHCCGK
jgi:preprotein translocase subunit SecA